MTKSLVKEKKDNQKRKDKQNNIGNKANFVIVQLKKPLKALSSLQHFNNKNQ